MNESSIQHVSDTAFLVAQCRVLESRRSDALFHDPLAARLAGDKGRALLETFPTASMLAWTVAVRTVIIDGFVRDAVERGVDVIINLGAGLDTRPYRLDLPPELVWIEVDYPKVIAFKSERLAGEIPRCKLERVGLDLSDVEARRALFRALDARSSRMLVVSEGLVPYLTLEQAAALAADLRAMPRAESWIVDYVSPESLAHRRRAGVQRHMQRAPLAFAPPDWFGFFREHGWRQRELSYLPEVGLKLGRPAPLPLQLRLLMKLLGPLTPKRRRERFSRFSGYARLEPSEPAP